MSWQNSHLFPEATIAHDHMCTAVRALDAAEQSYLESDRLYGPTATCERLRGANVAAQIGLMRAVGLSGRRICERRRWSLGFAS